MRNGIITQIERTILNRNKVYLVRLAPNYSFETSGSQVECCHSIRDILDITKSIIFCDGEIIKRM